MGAPPNTSLLPHPPTAPVLMTIATHCDPQMPVLYLPPPITTSQKALLPTTSSIQSFYAGLQQPQSVNPVSTLATRKQHFPMTVAFHSHESTTQPCLTLQEIQSEFILVPNSTQDRAAQVQLHPTSATLPDVGAYERAIIDCAPNDAHK